MEKKYYLGLDLGTNSVGWAVTDEEYNLCTYRKKDMWGVRLFEEAETAAGRRLSRGVRRRLERKKQRIALLQMLFEEEIRKIDDTFFIRLNESRLHIEDKSIANLHPLFSDDDYTDIEFYKEYPTMYHLRKHLISSTESVDIRKVYLALHHILKSRGHFLIDGDIGEVKDFGVAFRQLVDALRDEMDIDLHISSANSLSIKEILTAKGRAKSVKAKELSKLLVAPTDDKSDDRIKTEKNILENLCKLIVGNKGDISKFIAPEEITVEKKSFKFSDSNYDDEIKPEIDKQLPEISFILDKAKAVYDWAILVEVLGEEEYLSFAKVKQYEKHKTDLKDLRYIIAKYCDKKTYNDFFNSEKTENNYASYIGYVKKNRKKIDVKKCKDDELFFKNLKSILEKISADDCDANVYSRLLEKTELGTLLPLQRSKDNGVIPNQVHKQELELILNNASKYLYFLNEKDSDGLSVRDKIVSVFGFRIPYYVGPLSDRHKSSGGNSWIVRKAEGKIYPWNFDNLVDKEKSNEQFIKRMTNKCTYLIGEDVLPKQSILYSKFMVLNELNNLKVRGKKIPVELKQNIFCDLFLKHDKVTGKKLLNYLITHQDAELKLEDLSGFDENFKANMSSYLDFEKKVFHEKIKEARYVKIAEDCIKWATIYGDDKKMLATVVKKVYGDVLSKEEIEAISKLKYSGWGSLSEKFLNGLEGASKEDGEMFTIIKALWETNNNLMQLLSKNFTYIDEMKRYNSELSGDIGKITYENIVEELYVSPAVKRTIWQTIQIVEEIRKVQGCDPAKIFVEMARGEDKTKDRVNKKNNKTKSRKTKLIELYSACKDDVRMWTDEIDKKEERDFNSMKLYLYYTQKGRCMYTGEQIDIDKLMSANSLWDRDHIYPQSKIKDDSIDNLVLVNKIDNAKKSNGLLSSEIQQKMKSFWRELLEGGFISKEKYDRLTRRDDFTEDELAGFINRQLVETRQSSKAVAELLERMYPKSKVVYVKSELASELRKNPLKMLKSRRVNDHHHAKDAYLNIVAGNVYNTRFTSNPLKWLKEHKGEDFSINKVFYYDVKDINSGEKYAWRAPCKGDDKKALKNDEENFYGGTLDTVREVMRKNTVLYTEYTYCEKGELFNATLAKKSSGAAIPLKAGLDTEKYGGYTSAKTSYFALVEFDGKKGERVRQIIGVPICVANMLEHNPDAFMEYCRDRKQLVNVKILRDKIKKNALLRVDGYPMRLRGENERDLSLKNNIQPIFDAQSVETIRLIEKVLEKDSVTQVSEKYDKLDDDMLDRLFDEFGRKLNADPYIGRPANQYKLLQSGREIFQKLDLYQKSKVLNQILNYFRCDIATAADLKLIGGGSSAGNMAINKNTVGKAELLLINESVTGLFVNKEKL